MTTILIAIGAAVVVVAIANQFYWIGYRAGQKEHTEEENKSSSSGRGIKR